MEEVTRVYYRQRLTRLRRRKPCFAEGRPSSRRKAIISFVEEKEKIAYVRYRERGPVRRTDNVIRFRHQDRLSTSVTGHSPVHVCYRESYLRSFPGQLNRVLSYGKKLCMRVPRYLSQEKLPMFTVRYCREESASGVCSGANRP